MNRQTRAISNDLIQLAQDANALMVATADAAGEHVVEARKRLADALENGKKLYVRIREKEVEGVNTVETALLDHPYEAIAVGVGIVALLGYIISRRCRCNRG
jgi:ElaB/YqjD/DUF883 family membrane-anchored ribosome-binding protein